MSEDPETHNARCRLVDEAIRDLFASLAAKWTQEDNPGGCEFEGNLVVKPFATGALYAIAEIVWGSLPHTASPHDSFAKIMETTQAAVEAAAQHGPAGAFARGPNPASAQVH